VYQEARTKAEMEEHMRDTLGTNGETLFDNLVSVLLRHIREQVIPATSTFVTALRMTIDTQIDSCFAEYQNQSVCFVCSYSFLF
jgi:hypothetical protein